jgi:hypothetical protein
MVWQLRSVSVYIMLMITLLYYWTVCNQAQNWTNLAINIGILQLISQEKLV